MQITSNQLTSYYKDADLTLTVGNVQVGNIIKLIVGDDM